LIIQQVLPEVSHGFQCSRDILVTVDNGRGTYREVAGGGDAGVA
jgi:hypothetical protein